MRFAMPATPLRMSVSESKICNRGFLDVGASQVHLAWSNGYDNRIGTLLKPNTNPKRKRGSPRALPRSRFGFALLTLRVGIFGRTEVHPASINMHTPASSPTGPALKKSTRTTDRWMVAIIALALGAQALLGVL